jgi:hypothetical protein
MRCKNTPQENKILDYVNQTKNCYGENDKSSRKSIKKRKSYINRSFRREESNILNEQIGDLEKLDLELSEQPRKKWKKCADESLIESLASDTKLESELQKEAIKRLKKMNRETNL